MIDRSAVNTITIPENKVVNTYNQLLKMEDFLTSRNHKIEDGVMVITFIPCEQDQEDIENICLLMQDVFNSPRMYDDIYEMWQDMDSYEELQIKLVM